MNVTDREPRSNRTPLSEDIRLLYGGAPGF